jgi:hypothetical protein
MNAPRKPKPYMPPVSTDGVTPVPPMDPAVSIIVRHDDAVPVEILHEFYRNPNKGDTKVIRESIRENGLFRSIVANVGTLTGRPYEILAGNHTLKSTVAEGGTHVSVDWVDVDDQRAVKIMAVDNQAAAKARRDTDILADLLGNLDDLEGTGFTDDDLAKMGGVTDEEMDEVFAARFELVVEV